MAFVRWDARLVLKHRIRPAGCPADTGNPTRITTLVLGTLRSLSTNTKIQVRLRYWHEFHRLTLEYKTTVSDAPHPHLVYYQYKLMLVVPWTDEWWSLTLRALGRCGATGKTKTKIRSVIYRERYRMTIDHSPTDYRVEIKIPLHQYVMALHGSTAPGSV